MIPRVQDVREDPVTAAVAVGDRPAAEDSVERTPVVARSDATRTHAEADLRRLLVGQVFMVRSDPRDAGNADAHIAAPRFQSNGWSVLGFVTVPTPRGMKARYDAPVVVVRAEDADHAPAWREPDP